MQMFIYFFPTYERWIIECFIALTACMKSSANLKILMDLSVFIINVIKNIELAKVIFWSRFTSIVIIFFTLLLTQNVHIAKPINSSYLIRPWQCLSRTVMLSWKSGPFRRPQSVSRPWIAHPSFRVLEKRTLFPLSEGCFLENTWVWQQHRLRRIQSLVLQPQRCCALSQVRRKSNQRQWT